MSDRILDPNGRYLPSIDELVSRYSKEGSKLNISLIEDEDVRLSMAKLLWNQETRDPIAEMSSMFGEATTTTSMGGSNAQFQPYAMALMRRLFPALFAHNVVGVQSLNGPVGLAYALRVKYGDGFQEANFDQVDKYSGFTGTTSGTSASASDTGRGVTTSVAEAWKIGTDYPELKIEISQVAIEAKSRKLAASFTIESAQDLKAMHNVDIAREMIRYLQAEIAAELDRELIDRMKKAAVDIANGGEAALVVDVDASDGRWHQEKLAVVTNTIIDMSNKIASSTFREAGNFVIVSPKVATALQASGGSFSRNAANVNNTVGSKIAEVGTINGAITVYRDIYARNDFALVGYKGEGVSDSGLIYSPYITGLMNRTIGENDFTPRIGCMSRYAVTDSLLGAGRYYRYTSFTNLDAVISATA